MIKFEYKDQKLHLTDVVDGKVAKSVDLSKWTEGRDNAFYLYYLPEFERRCKAYKDSFRPQDKVHFAIKCNSHPKVLETARQQGLGIDLVSGGELKKALDAKFKPEDLIFSGVAKSKEDLGLAITQGVAQINVESPQELKRIIEVARSLKKTARVAFRFNPDVSVDTHPYIRTGFRDNKFGMDESFFPELTDDLRKAGSAVDLVGITLHIGSQIRNVESFVEAVEKSISPFKYLSSLGFKLSTFDIGGGLGIDYENDPSEAEFQTLTDFSRKARALLEPLGVRILSEPGRFLVARSGYLLTQVQYIKKTQFKNFVIVNTGMHHLMRPSLYRAYHRILPLKERIENPKRLLDVVGPVCESSDVVGYDRVFHEPVSGDWLAVLDTGAYGAVMSSSYNAFPPAEEFFI